MSRGHKRGSGERSNSYSESKFSNWGKFNPFDAEIDSLPRWTEASIAFETSAGGRISVVARDLHPEFVSPVTAEDVRNTLVLVPPEFVAELTTVYLLGGTSKQDKVALGRLFRYGCYWNCKIALHAFPKRMLSERYTKLPSPDIMQEYERMGATWTPDKHGWLFDFTLEALRAFYLYDVLLHEVGHHVDRTNRSLKSSSESEHYAKWFAQFCGQEIGLI